MTKGKVPLPRAETRVLGKPEVFLRDRGIGERDDLGGRPVVGLEPEDGRAGVPLGELEDVVVVRPSKPVDRLGIIADGREVPCSFAGQGFDQVGLHGVGVLHLVDQDVTEHLRLHGPLLGELGQEPGPLAEEVVVIHAVGGFFPGCVGQLGGFELGKPLLPVGMAFEGDFLEGAADVEGEAEGVLDARCLGAHPGGPAHPGVFHRQANQVELILAIEDGEVLAEPENLGRLPQEPVANMVERPGPDLASLRADQGFEPVDHLASGPAGEGDEQDGFSRHTPGDQISHPVGDDPGLARTRAGEDQVEAVGGCGRRVLGLVEVAGKVGGQPIVARFLEPDLSHAACSPVDGLQSAYPLSRFSTHYSRSRVVILVRVRRESQEGRARSC